MNLNAELLMCSTTDERIAHLASIEAERSTLPMRHGCVAVSGGKIIAKGCNSYRTFSKDGLIHNTCSCHAEIDVLRKCMKKNRKGKINIYVVRISKNGEYLNSAPCNQCVNVMKTYNIGRIVYSTHEGLLQQCKLVHYTNVHKCGGERAIDANRVSSVQRGNRIVFKEAS